jgi:hypothetical protein
MIKRFFITGLLTTIVNLALHTLAYIFVLKDVYEAFPAGPAEFIRQLQRKPEELIVWGMVVTSLAMGFLITIVMKWSGANTILTGLKSGSLFGFLFWISVNFGLYASSNFFSLTSVFVDTALSSTVMTLSAAFAAWMLGRE